MSALASKVTECKCSSLHRVVNSGDEKYLCFTRLSTDDLVVCVSDGISLWKVELDEEEADALRDLANINTIDAYLTRMR